MVKTKESSLWKCLLLCKQSDAYPVIVKRLTLKAVESLTSTSPYHGPLFDHKHSTDLVTSWQDSVSHVTLWHIIFSEGESCNAWDCLLQGYLGIISNAGAAAHLQERDRISDHCVPPPENCDDDQGVEQQVVEKHHKHGHVEYCHLEE